MSLRILHRSLILLRALAPAGMQRLAVRAEPEILRRPRVRLLSGRGAFGIPLAMIFAVFAAALAGCAGPTPEELAIEHINAMKSLAEILKDVDSVDRAGDSQERIAEALERSETAYARLQAYLEGASDADVVKLDRQHGAEYQTAEARLKGEISRLRLKPRLMAAAFGSASSPRLGIEPPVIEEPAPAASTVAKNERPAPAKPVEKAAPSPEPPKIKKPEPFRASLADVRAARLADNTAEIVRTLRGAMDAVSTGDRTESAALLRDLLTHTDPTVQEAAFQLLTEAKLADQADIGVGLKKNSLAVRRKALNGVREGKLAIHVPAVVEMLKYRDVADSAMRCLEAFDDKPALIEDAVLEVFENYKFPDAAGAQVVCQVLGACGSEKCRPFLQKIRGLGAQYAEDVSDAWDRIKSRKGSAPATDAPDPTNE